jgi:hypothetical protein
MNLSFAAAALFLCLPMHVESVAWISERKDVLSTPLLLGAMLAYQRFSQSPRRWGMYGLMLTLFTFSLMTKTMGVTLPAILLLLDFWPLKRLPDRHLSVLVMEKIPLLLIAAAFSVLESLAQADAGATASLRTISIIDRIDNAIVCYVIYIVKLAVPTGLSFYYVHPFSRPIPAVVAAAGVLCLITLVCWRSRRRRPYAIVGWLWFLGTLVPVIGLVQVGKQAMADRYSYLPSIGLLIAAVWGIASLVRSGLLRSALLCIAVATYSLMAHRQASYWRGTEALATHAAEVTDDNPPAHVMLGKIAYARHDIRRAVNECNLALKYRDEPEAYDGLGNCWLQEDPAKAVTYYRRAIELNAHNMAYVAHLAMALHRHGELEDALRTAKSALEKDPDNAEARAELESVTADMKKVSP